jgi:alkylation response protein AidB-like acyl-CoA dehydrogenase
MKLLARERAVCEQYLPGLDSKLSAIPVFELESPRSGGVALYRAAGGAGVLIPKVHGGGGASAVDAVRFTRAIAARSPSLAVATSMHQFSVASLVALAKYSNGPEWMLLDAVARDQRLMASGFAEGRSSQSILMPTMKGVWDGSNWRVSGRKQPCSLSRSMDLLTASVTLQHPEQGSRLAIAVIPAESKGITLQPFWNSWALAGAESHAVVLNDVEVHPDLIVEIRSPLHGGFDDLQTLGFLWFELLVSAAYLGIAAALVEQLLEDARGAEHESVALGVAVEGAALALDCAARNLDEGDSGNDGLARALIVRFTVANVVQATVAKAVELLGGMAFARTSDVACLAAASHGIGFHPPSRQRSAGALLEWFRGHPLVVE